MIILYVLIPVIILAIILGIIWARMRARGLLVPAGEAKLKFHLRYIISPLLLLAVYAVIAAVFYNIMPFGQTAYHFLMDGTPDAFASRAAVAGIGLAIQAALVLISLGIVLAVSRSGFLSHSEGALIKPETLLTVMGNLPAIIQVILVFAMYDIFSYNAYQKHLLPLWLFAVIILAIVTIAFILLIILYTIRAARQNKP